MRAHSRYVVTIARGIRGAAARRRPTELRVMVFCRSGKHRSYSLSPFRAGGSDKEEEGRKRKRNKQGL